jgi:hypothetical protein
LRWPGSELAKPNILTAFMPKSLTILTVAKTFHIRMSRIIGSAKGTALPQLKQR